jgi:hypothetical protein
MIDWIVSRKAPQIILLLGALCIFFACFTIDPSKSSIVPQLLPKPRYPVIGLGGILLLVGALATLLDRVPVGLKELAGEWTYSVRDCEMESAYSHGGIAEFFQKGHRIRIDGFRRYMTWRDTDGNHEYKADIHWHTSWGWLDDEGVLRYDYDMAIPGRGGRIMGYVRIQINEKVRRPEKMIGTYYILPPYSNELPNTRWGTITWERKANDRPSRWSRWISRASSAEDDGK